MLIMKTPFASGQYGEGPNVIHNDNMKKSYWLKSIQLWNKPASNH